MPFPANIAWSNDITAFDLDASTGALTRDTLTFPANDIDDDTTDPFANSLVAGPPSSQHWFNATLSAPDYAGNPTYPAHCGASLPMGRPSTVTQP